MPNPIAREPESIEGLTWSEYAKHLFKDSTINGVHHVANADNYFRKLLWIGISLFCAFGFSSQLIDFLVQYYKYPTMVEVQVVNRGSLEFPSVTICNSNRLRRSAFCKNFPKKCSKVKNMKFTLNDSSIVDFQRDMLKSRWSRKKRSFLGHQLKDLIVSCVFTGIPELSGSNCTSRFVPAYDPGYGNCYTMLSKIPTNASSEEDWRTEQEREEDLPEENRTMMALESDVWQQTSELQLVLNVEAAEYTEESRVPSVRVALHPADTAPDVYSDGMEVQAGHSCRVGVSKESVEMLPFPYQTNCTDYDNLPWKDGGKKFTTRKCTASCSQKRQLDQCNYVIDELSIFYEYLPWDTKDDSPENEECAIRVNEESRDICRKECRVPCKTTTFKTNCEATDWPPEDDYQKYDSLGNWRKKDLAAIKDNIVQVVILYNTMDETVYQHQAKYDTLGLFSYLGGYIGIWLGISLVAICEFIEKCVMLLIFPCRKRFSSAPEALSRNSSRKSRRRSTRSRGSARVVHTGESKAHGAWKQSQHDGVFTTNAGLVEGDGTKPGSKLQSSPPLEIPREPSLMNEPLSPVPPPPAYASPSYPPQGRRLASHGSYHSYEERPYNNSRRGPRGYRPWSHHNGAPWSRFYSNRSQPRHPHAQQFYGDIYGYYNDGRFPFYPRY